MPLVLGLRYPIAGVAGLRREPVALLEESRVRMRVRLSDCDLNLHVNNGRYLSLMDIGRIDHAARTGIITAFRRRTRNPVAGGATIRFRRELRVGTRYDLVTQILGWDEGWTFWGQRFERLDGALAARAVVKVATLDGAGTRLPSADVLRALGVDAPSPPLPDDVQAWMATSIG
jgi:acyl-CoA thioesterase FadM